MGFIDAVKNVFAGSRDKEGLERQEENIRRAFKNRCTHFKALLSANKRALYAMSSLEEAMRGERLFGMSFVRARCTTITANVFNMVRYLNALSDNGYPVLFERITEIGQRISEITAPKTEFSLGPLVLALDKVDYSLAHETGAKMASLGDLRQRIGVTIPQGFVVTASGYRRFIQANDLQEEINRRIQITDLGKLDAVFALSSSLQQLIMSSPFPDDLTDEIMAHYRVLAEQNPGLRLAVRSSAIGEDALGASYAGQYRSELNIAEESLLDTIKEVIASKYDVTAMSYRTNRGIPDDEVPMCVGCLKMVEAEAGGVVYSLDPTGSHDHAVVCAVPGLPKAVVDGSADLDVFHVARSLPHTISKREIARKTFRIESAPEEGTVKVPLTPEQADLPCLNDAQAIELAVIALGFEVFYGKPQDVEWAIDREGDIIILQSRALPDGVGRLHSLPLPEGATLLLEGGVCASPGAGVGPVFHIRRNADMLRVSAGAVLVVEHAYARWAPVLSRASAIVSEHGGTAGHLASVAREYGIPAIFGLSNAAATLQEDDLVTIDADSTRVLQGRVEELLVARKKNGADFSGSPVHNLLTQAVKHIVPLNLIDPESPEFAPEHCRTLHDITRFCHEKSVEEMFRMDALEDSLFADRYGKQLKYKGSKLQYFVVNMENGFCEDVRDKYIELHQICCPPMHALWQGMLAIPWAGPTGTTAKGFLSLVAESAGNRELEITSASTRMVRNYFLVDRDYCNLQASFGYHFCTVEAQAGEATQENYINFHFKGGAANMARRLMRINAMADVLIENGFIVDVKEDALSARAEELEASDALELLLVLGYLLIHTRQMDAAMHGEDSRVAFADGLRKGIANVLATGVAGNTD